MDLALPAAAKSVLRSGPCFGLRQNDRIGQGETKNERHKALVLEAIGGGAEGMRKKRRAGAMDKGSEGTTWPVRHLKIWHTNDANAINNSLLATGRFPC